MAKSGIYKSYFLKQKGVAKLLAKNRRMLPKKARTNPRAKVLMDKIKSKNDIIASQKITKGKKI